MSIAVLRGTSLAAMAASLFADDGVWVGCQMLDMDSKGILLYVGQATSLAIYCVDKAGHVRAVRTLVVSGRKKVSLI